MISFIRQTRKDQKSKRIKMIIQRLFRNKLIYHYLFWILIIVSYFVAHTDYIEKVGWTDFFLTIFLRHVLLMFLVYANINFLLPRFYKKNKHLVYYSLLIVLMASFILLQWIYVRYSPFISGSQKEISEILNFSFWDSLLTALRFTVFAIILKLSIEWYDQNDRLKSMQIEKLQADINFLRTQINPHFLFNTLNSLYALALKKSDETPNAVMLLSKMMSYMLYESNELYVPLNMEVENMKNFIEIEKIRMGKNLQIKFETKGDLGHVRIAPHLFLPFVENAFKHGSDNKSGKVNIEIELHVKANSIHFTIVNSKEDHENKQRDGSGLGLKNAKRRLELFYREHYILNIQNNENQFKVDLNLKDIKPDLNNYREALHAN